MSKEKNINFPQSSKMRIRLYDGNFMELSDRLVDQSTEFRNGPKESHKGPMTIEVNLSTQIDLDMFVDYLKKVKGDLPITEKVKQNKAEKTIAKMLSDKEPLLDLIKTIKAKAKTQEDIIKMLREYNFKFISGDVIQDMTTHDPNIGKQIQLRQKDIDDNFQYMVRLVKEAKEPMNDKYDFRLVFGIKIIGDRVGKVVIYLWGKYSEFVKIPWADKKKFNFKKVDKVYSFPDWMDYTDRKKWRTEHRKKLTAEAKGDKFETSKFYDKHVGYVKGVEI